MNEKIKKIQQSMLPVGKDVIVHNQEDEVEPLRVIRKGIAPVHTKHGKFWLMDFEVNDRWREYCALYRGALDDEKLTPEWDSTRGAVVRIDSECIPGMTFGDLACDCREQLHLALERINDCGQGLVVHIRNQDGRGKGFGFHLGTLWLQDALGLDTVASAIALTEDGRIDARSYEGAVAIIKFLGLPVDLEISVATNNPSKIQVLRSNGYQVHRTSLSVQPTRFTYRHFLAKRDLLGHDGLLAEVAI